MKKDNYQLQKKIYLSKTIDKYYKKSIKLGNNDINQVIKFMDLRVCFSILLFIYLFISFNFNIIFPIILVIVFYNIFPYFVYDIPIKNRSLKLEKEAIYFFEVFNLSVKSGKNLNQAFEITVKNVDSSLSNEIKKTLEEVKFGKSFSDSFLDLSRRIPSDIIQNIILNIVEVYKTGGDISLTLDRQLEFIRNKRIMDIKEKINKIPIKVSIVSVLLFIPLILLLIFAPFIVEYFG